MYARGTPTPQPDVLCASSFISGDDIDSTRNEIKSVPFSSKTMPVALSQFAKNTGGRSIGVTLIVYVELTTVGVEIPFG